MRLPAELQAAVDAAAAAAVTAAGARRAIGLLDLTTLEADDTEERVASLCRRALTPLGPVAAVCVWPRFVPAAAAALRAAAEDHAPGGRPVRVATVVNFPAGDADPAAVAAETTAAIAAGADEVDVVFPYVPFLDGGRAGPRAVLDACRQACGDAVPMKVILETGRFPDAGLLDRAAREAIAAGAAFLKTSTGKLQPAATPEAAAVLAGAIHASGAAAGPKSVGLKVSGGVRDAAAAARYLQVAEHILGPGWAHPDTFRFGASALLEALLTAAGTAVDERPSSSY